MDSIGFPGLADRAARTHEMTKQIIYCEQMIRDGEQLTLSVVLQDLPMPCFVARLDWVDGVHSSHWEQRDQNREQSMMALHRACLKDVHFQSMTAALHLLDCKLPFVA